MVVHQNNLKSKEWGSWQDKILKTFDLYESQSVQNLCDGFIDKAVCDCDGRHIGFVSDVLVSSWNNRPEYVVIDAKIKPWHMRNAQFFYPISSIHEVNRVSVLVKDNRASVYESAVFDPEVVELQESFPLVSVRRISDTLDFSEETPSQVFLNKPAYFWSEELSSDL